MYDNAGLLVQNKHFQNIYKYAIIFHFTSFPAEHNMSILSLCTEASSFHITFVYADYQTGTGFRAICDVTICARRPASSYQIFSVHREDLHFRDEYVNSLLI